MDAAPRVMLPLPLSNRHHERVSRKQLTDVFQALFTRSRRQDGKRSPMAVIRQPVGRAGYRVDQD